MIAAVVLTFDAPAGMLEACVRSVLADGRVHVVVVDNGRRARELPADVLAAAELIETPANLGYAGGMNAGIGRALARGAGAVALLNDDVTVEPGWLDPLLAELGDGRRDGSGVGAVQPKLLFADGPPWRINSVGVSLGPDGAGHDVAIDQPDTGHDDPTDLEVFTGGAVLLGAELLRDLGGFDERFFLYYEDVDLALRGAERGWRYRCAPASRVLHRGSATVARDGEVAHRIIYLRERNRLWVLLRHRPAGDVGRGLWLSVRRLRWAPRWVHARALAAGLAAAPRLLLARLRAARRGR